MFKCYKCKKIVIDNSLDGLIKIRSRILLIKKNGFIILCPSCKSEITLRLNLPLLWEQLIKLNEAENQPSPRADTKHSYALFIDPYEY